MNKSHAEAKALFDGILESQNAFPADVSVIVAPPFVYLNEFVKQSESVSQLAIAAQNCAKEKAGAYTGEVSTEMLRSIGVEYILVGHSERRALFGETDNLLAEKVKAVIADDIVPIFCIGEQLEEREAGNHFEVIKHQLETGLFHFEEAAFRKVIVAYEPVWAIGTGKVATSEQAQEIHAHVRQLVAEKYNSKTADELTILYGGSCKPENAAELFACADVDGGLIGGAALQPQSFLEIVKAAGH